MGVIGMVRKLIQTALVIIIGSSCQAFAAGYRIPEQSLNATALSSAYIANANAPDAAYYNPANMSWAGHGWDSEFGVSLIYLPSIDYENDPASPNVGAPYYASDGSTKEEYFAIPTFFAVSPPFHNFRFGFAMVSPAGLAKRWDDPYQKGLAQESSMTVIEANPSLSYKVNEMFSVAVGARLLYSMATLKSDSGAFIRDMDGDATEYGYNVALTFKPVKELALAATYRSKIELDMDGDVTLIDNVTSFPTPIEYRGDGSVTIPIPAVLTLAAAYTLDKATFEFTYERSYWSIYDKLDFEYPSALPSAYLTAYFDDPIKKDWNDVDAYKFGLTYTWSPKLILMVGGGIYGNPVPDATISFDLPDSDSWFASLGFRYKHSEKLSYGAAYLHAEKKDRTATSADFSVDGTFSGAASNLLVFSLAYLF